MKSATYRDLAWGSLANVVREAAATMDMRKELEAALAQLRVGFDAAVDAVPAVAMVLDRIPDNRESGTVTVDPINRADEIAAHISDAFHRK